jgi:hypothetical protein
MQTQNTITTMANTNNGKAAKTTTNPASQISNYVTLLLDREARQLAKMRARGKKNAQIIDWLRNRGVNATVTGLHAYWQHLAEQQAKQKQQWTQANPQRANAGGQNRELEPPTVDDECDLAHRSGSTTVRESAADGYPMAGGHTAAARQNKEVANPRGGRPPQEEPTTEEIMAKYRRLLMKMLDQGETSPETVKLINHMIRNVISYERSQIQAKERELKSKHKAEPKDKAKMKEPAKQEDAAVESEANELKTDPNVREIARCIAALPLTMEEKIAKFRKEFFGRALVQESEETDEAKKTLKR